MSSDQDAAISFYCDLFGWQAEKSREDKGSGIANEPGSFTWNELLSRDPQASRDFFGKVFGYDWEAMAGFESMDYNLAQLGGQPAYGLMIVPPNIPAEVPSHWNNYFAVANTDDTVARGVASGATVMAPPMDSPFGRMAVLDDPQGAAFSVIQLAQQ
jgi:predicted enzyme related to lactoylglutathione lyase